MSLIKEYAFEPEALNSWEAFRYFFEKLGFSRGRFGVRLPAGWEAEVLRACKQAAPQEDYKLIEARLQKFGSNRLLDAPPFGSAKPRTWWAQVQACHQRRPLAGVVITAARPAEPNDPPIAVARDVSEDFMPDETEVEVGCTAEELAETLKPLLRLSSRVILVDPYFNPQKRKFTATLGALMDLAARERCGYIDVITAEAKEKQCPTELIAQRIRQASKPSPRTPQVCIAFIEPPGRDRFHHRLVLSDIGGIRIEAGSAAEGSHTTNEVMLMGDRRHKELWAKYGGDLSTLDVKRRWAAAQPGFRLQ